MSFTSAARRDVSLIVVAKSVGWFGDAMATLALTLQLQSAGHGAGAVAALLIADALPIVLLSGVAGRLVDRLDSRRLLVATTLAQAGVCTMLAESHSTAQVLALVAVLGAGQAVVGATWQALLAEAAPADVLPAAMGQAQAGMTLAGVAAPACAGVLVGAFSVRVPLLIDAGSFVACALLAMLIATRRRVASPADGVRPRGGWAIVRADALLRPLFGLLGLLVLLGCMVNVVDVFLVRETLHASTTWYGIVGAAFSAGAVAGALASGRLHGAERQARAFVGAGIALALGIAAIGLVPSVGVLLPVSVAVGFTNGSLNVTLSSLVMGTTPADERGRVGAALGATASGTQILAFAASGALASALSPREIFVGAGLLGATAPALLGRRLLRAAHLRATPPLDIGPGQCPGVRRTFRGGSAWASRVGRASGRRGRAPSHG